MQTGVALLLIVVSSLVFTAGLVRVLQVHFIRRKFRESFDGIPSEIRAQWAAERLWKFARRNAVEGGTIVANTGQTLFHLSRIDNRVLQAIDQVHDPSQVNSYSQIVRHLGRLRGGTKQWNGATSTYKGEVGESLMAEHLALQGHIVEMAEPGTPGYDAHVDGQPVNFKVGLDRSHIDEHLRNYPNIPVLTVAEQAQAFGDHPMVTCLESVSGEQIAEATSQTATSVLELGDFDTLPVMTAVFSAMRNFKPVVQGKSGDIGAALQYTAADVVGVGVGGFAGAKIGAGVGTAVLPVVGTAVGAILGGVAGVIGGRFFANHFKGKDLRKAVGVLETALGKYGAAYIEGLEAKAGRLQKAAASLVTVRPWWRYVAPTPGDVVRADARMAYRRWAASCRKLAKALQQEHRNAANNGPDYTLLAKNLISKPTEEPVFSRELMHSINEMKECLLLVQTEQAKLGRSQ